jgi:hypothetical protein
MDHLHQLSPRRLTRAFCAFILGILLAAFTLPVFADYPASRYHWVRGCSGVQRLNDPEAACRDVVNDHSETCWHSSGQENYTYSHVADGRCYATRLNGTLANMYMDVGEQFCPYGGSYRGGGICSGDPVCPAGQVYDPNANKCAQQACALGQVRNTITQQCQPPCHGAGTSGGSDYVSPYTIQPKTICRDGCELNVGGGTTIPNSSGTDWYMVTGLTHTGEFCTGAIDANGDGTGYDSHDEPTDLPPVSVTPDTDPPRCEAGKCPGTINGQYQCMPCKDVATPEKPVTQYDTKTETQTTGTPPDRTTTSTTTQTKATHDGSGTVTTSTTSTKTTTGPDGNGGTTTTTETSNEEKKEPQESFCKENPTSAFCKEGKWSGTCESEFQCDGDAVQCATAKAAWGAYCLDKKYEETQAGNLAAAILSGNDPDAENNPLNPENIDDIDIAARAAVAPRQLSESCIPDQSFVVAGATFTLDTSKFCELMSICGNILVALASIAAFRIVGGTS